MKKEIGNMNIKLPKEELEQLKQIAKDLGDISLSALIRMLIRSRLDKVKSTNNLKNFLE